MVEKTIKTSITITRQDRLILKMVKRVFRRSDSQIFHVGIRNFLLKVNAPLPPYGSSLRQGLLAIIDNEIKDWERIKAIVLAEPSEVKTHINDKEAVFRNAFSTVDDSVLVSHLTNDNPVARRLGLSQERGQEIITEMIEERKRKERLILNDSTQVAETH